MDERFHEEHARLLTSVALSPIAADSSHVEVYVDETDSRPLRTLSHLDPDTLMQLEGGRPVCGAVGRFVARVRRADRLLADGRGVQVGEGGGRRDARRVLLRGQQLLDG